MVDIAASAVLLVATAPIVGAAALAILVTSGWPVVYVSKRWGRDDRQLDCFKLRTMRVAQRGLLEARGLSETGEDGRTLIHENDPRIDRVGAFLRKWSIDEFPQFVNVLLGDMSLIGPRALAISMLQDVADIRRARSVMRPGITGLWQVRARRKNVGVLDMIDDDLEYIRTFSLGLDLRIALRTLTKLVEP
jgi:lipopolysaccharide/colanic/teichoic acid biosynthesis glycosyltransferase